MNFPAELLKQCWFLAGPTAVGKTATALHLAGLLNAEILSMDSMAIYRQMDIGTAKPDTIERSKVPHHLLDLVDPHQDFSMAEYCHAAVDAATDVVLRGRTPLFVGGTGLYLRAILRGTFDGPSADWDFRRQLEQDALKLGPEELHRRLTDVDSVSAARLHSNDQRRIIRALEVFHLTGVPLSAQQNNLPVAVSDRPPAVAWLEPDREWLRTCIDQRVNKMMDKGLLEETRRLLNSKPPPGRTARQALGYRELITHLEDDVPLPQAVELIQVRTRQFAKRQHTWFRNLEECTAVPVGTDPSAEQLAERIHRQFRGN